jgi:hypothetical protein
MRDILVNTMKEMKSLGGGGEKKMPEKPYIFIWKERMEIKSIEVTEYNSSIFHPNFAFSSSNCTSRNGKHLDLFVVLQKVSGGLGASTTKSLKSRKKIGIFSAWLN